TPLSHTPAAVERAGGFLRRGDLLDALDLTGDASTLARALGAWRADYLLVDASTPTWPTWRDRPPPPLAPVAGGPDWTLLRADPARLADALPASTLVSITPPAPVAGDVA